MAWSGILATYCIVNKWDKPSVVMPGETEKKEEIEERDSVCLLDHKIHATHT